MKSLGDYSAEGSTDFDKLSAVELRKLKTLLAELGRRVEIELEKGNRPRWFEIATGTATDSSLENVFHFDGWLKPVAAFEEQLQFVSVGRCPIVFAEREYRELEGIGFCRVDSVFMHDAFLPAANGTLVTSFKKTGTVQKNGELWDHFDIENDNTIEAGRQVVDCLHGWNRRIEARFADLAASPASNLTQTPEHNSAGTADPASPNATVEAISSEKGEPIETFAAADQSLNEQPPPFDATSSDWMLGPILAKQIDLSTATMSDYRKAGSKTKDLHGEWGQDSIGVYRANVNNAGNVAYFVPKLKPLYAQRLVHSKKT